MLTLLWISPFVYPKSVQARKHILEIHTRDWNPKLAEPFLDELAEKCVGKSNTFVISNPSDNLNKVFMNRIALISLTNP